MLSACKDQSHSSELRTRAWSTGPIGRSPLGRLRLSSFMSKARRGFSGSINLPSLLRLQPHVACVPHGTCMAFPGGFMSHLPGCVCVCACVHCSVCVCAFIHTRRIRAPLQKRVPACVRVCRPRIPSGDTQRLACLVSALSESIGSVGVSSTCLSLRLLVKCPGSRVQGSS